MCLEPSVVVLSWLSAKVVVSVVVLLVVVIGIL
jgi:hypothetical protein